MPIIENICERKTNPRAKRYRYNRRDVGRLLYEDETKPSKKEESNQEISENNFRQLLTDTAAWFDGLGYLKILKVLYKDLLSKSNVEVERARSVWDLLQDLRASGSLSTSNLTLLYDTITVTKQFGFQSNVENQPPKDIKDHVVSMLTPFRQKVYQLGVELTKDEVSTLARLFNNILVKTYQDSWSMIMDFEHRGIIDEDFTKMVVFRRVLEQNGMTKARKIFIDGMSRSYDASVSSGAGASSGAGVSSDAGVSYGA
ncbi:uncharacterized protein [Antedon mediterranea]|uniref:uncharacterized protein n=1 Tax=Antedon mediterranea TaxID=105859 RepID=UPI003AF97820